MAIADTRPELMAAADVHLAHPTSPAGRVFNGTSVVQRSNTLPTHRNVKEVVLTDIRIDTWYPSFYPEDLVGKLAERLYVCTWCFRYTLDQDQFIAHSKCCSLRDGGIVGRTIYESGSVKVCEIDGEDHRMFAQNLSLFAKLFLDTKSVFFDVTTFLYYVLYIEEQQLVGSSPRIVGFFSKEKLSWDSNNLACICVFPPWQKRGLGQILMGSSYVLSKYDGRLGGPEKPLSELGRKAYIQFWSATIARHVVSMPQKKKITVQSISEATFILPEDVIASLQDMNVIERKNHGRGAATISKSKVVVWMASKRIDTTGPVDEDAFIDLTEVMASDIGD